MSVTTSSIQVHVLPNKATIHLHEADRELVGVHGVEVDVMDYPSQQATAALNAFNANVTLNRAEHFTLMVLDPKKQSWLTPPEGHQTFPSDGDYSGMLDVPLLPLGCVLEAEKDVAYEDGDGQPIMAGSKWKVLAADRATVRLVCEDTEAEIFMPVCQLHEGLVINTGYDEDAHLSADQLDDKYNPEGAGEHPMFTRQMWREAVANEDTICGYWSWLVSEIAQAHWK